MKVSQLVTVLKDIEKEYGDLHIWSLNGLDAPCPDIIEIELTKKLRRTDYGFTSGKANETKDIEVFLEYEGGVNLEDRSIQEKES